MKKIIITISIFLLSCEDSSSDDSIKYVTAKQIKSTFYSIDGNMINWTDYRWEGNKVEEIINYYSGNNSLDTLFEIHGRYIYNDYGFILSSADLVGPPGWDIGSVFSETKYTRKDKWKITKEENARYSTNIDYIWDGNIQKGFREDGSIMRETEYDDYGRMIKETTYLPNGEIDYQDTQVWDENYRFRSLNITRSTYKNDKNPLGYYSESAWYGDSCVTKQYWRTGNSYSRTFIVNEYDQVIKRFEYGNYYSIIEYGDLFKPYN